jgi:hypothetical protein
MNIYLLIQAAECLREACEMTPDPKERETIKHALAEVLAILRSRGVFLGV